VVVPTYSRPGHIRACASALRALDYPAERLEILIVDDGSPTPVSILPGGPGAPGVRVIRQANAGPARARNRGSAEASGSILAFTDDDCRPDPGWLRALVPVVTREPEVLAGGLTVNGLEGNLMAEASQVLVDYLYEAFADARELQAFFTSNNVAVSTAAYRDLGGFDETFRFNAGEDRELGERWARESGPLRFVPQARVLHYHDMGLWGFLRQHHRYGRGGAHLARLRRERGAPPPSLESPPFYGRMLTFPLRDQGLLRGMALAALMGASQAATLTGILRELVLPSWSGAVEPPHGSDPRTGDSS
jgi:GT2 family glycosyltransferase